MHTVLGFYFPLGIIAVAAVVQLPLHIPVLTSSLSTLISHSPFPTYIGELERAAVGRAAAYPRVEEVR